MESPVEAEAFEGSSESAVWGQTETILQNETAEDGVTQDVHPNGPEGPHSEPEPEPEPDDPTDPQHSGRWEAAAENYAPENATPVSPDLSEMMQDPRPPVNNNDDDKEELIVLGPDHELVKRHQAALNVLLKKELERINLALQEKLALDKADQAEIEHTSMEIHRMNQKLVKQQYKIDDLHQTKVKTKNKHGQALKKLKANKSQFLSTTNKYKEAKANVSQLQSETDSLVHKLTLTQEVSDKLQSNLKSMRNATHKAEVEKFQAEEQKLKQDLYVKRLTKEMERLTEQVALYNAQTLAQADETQAAKEGLSEAEMEMASLLMARKQLLQQWNSSLVDMRRRGEAFTAMQEAERMLEHQLLSLDREIKGHEKAITEEQEQNEILTMQLNRAQMDNATSKAKLNQKQAQQEAMQAHYSTTLRTLRETECTLGQLTKETSNLEGDVKDQRRQMEKESALRLELEDKITSGMQQRLVHNNATKGCQKLSEKLTVLKKEKITQLWQLENDILASELETSEIGQNLDNLAFTQKALDEQMSEMDKLLSDQASKKSSFFFSIGQKQGIISKLKKMIDKIVADTGNQDLSPLQIKANALKAQLEELEGNTNRDHHLWIKRQDTLVGLTQELENTSKNILKLQTEYTCMQQERIRLENSIEEEHREEQDIQKNTQNLRRDLTRLNTHLSKNKQLSKTLEQDNALMQMDFNKKLQEEELKSIEMKTKWEKTAEEKDRLFNCIVEADQQIMLWEKKIQIAKETYAAVKGEKEQGEVRSMKAEIHRMEVRLTRLMKERERLLRESEATVARREKIMLRRESLLRNPPNSQRTKAELQRQIQSLKHKNTSTNKQVVKCEQVIGELQESQVSLGSRISQQKQQITDICGHTVALEEDLANLVDTKAKNFSRLVALQNRSKKLQSVKDKSYKPVSNSESVDAAIQSQTERVNKISAIVNQVCQDNLQHKGALRKVNLALEAHSST